MTLIINDNPLALQTANIISLLLCIIIQTKQKNDLNHGVGLNRNKRSTLTDSTNRFETKSLFKSIGRINSSTRFF